MYFVKIFHCLTKSSIFSDYRFALKTNLGFYLDQILLLCINYYLYVNCLALDLKSRKGRTYKYLPAAASVNPSQPVISQEFFLPTEERTTALAERRNEHSAQGGNPSRKFTYVISLPIKTQSMAKTTGEALGNTDQISLHCGGARTRRQSKSIYK